MKTFDITTRRHIPINDHRILCLVEFSCETEFTRFEITTACSRVLALILDPKNMNEFFDKHNSTKRIKHLVLKNFNTFGNLLVKEMSRVNMLKVFNIINDKPQVVKLPVYEKRLSINGLSKDGHYYNGTLLVIYQYNDKNDIQIDVDDMIENQKKIQSNKNLDYTMKSSNDSYINGFDNSFKLEYETSGNVTVISKMFWYRPKTVQQIIVKNIYKTEENIQSIMSIITCGLLLWLIREWIDNLIFVNLVKKLNISKVQDFDRMIKIVNNNKTKTWITFILNIPIVLVITFLSIKYDWEFKSFWNMPIYLISTLLFGLLPHLMMIINSIL